MKLEYLSDRELEKLIQEVEERELVAAPPDLLEDLLEGLEPLSETIPLRQLENSPEQAGPAREASGNPRQEYWAYCFRVVTSMAAAIALVFLLPGLMSRLPGEVQEDQKPTQYFTAPAYATKEEAVKDAGYLREVLGGVNLFDGDDRLGIFREREEG